MNTELNTDKIAQLLDRGTQQLDVEVLSALSLARNNALNRQLAYNPIYAHAHGTVHWTHWLIPHSTQQWIAAGLFVAAIVGGTNFWQHAQEQQISELDVAILTDELPIEVFVD